MVAMGRILADLPVGSARLTWMALAAARFGGFHNLPVRSLPSGTSGKLVAVVLRPLRWPGLEPRCHGARWCQQVTLTG
jgi:hypothetical protein